MLTGTFEAYHVDVGKLMFPRDTGIELARKGVFFFGATYVVPQTGNFGKLEPIPLPALHSSEWSSPDSTTMESVQRKMILDIQSSLKPTYGSHISSITLFMPIHVFVAIFKSTTIHRTPTMWISKNGVCEALDAFLKGDWTTKIVEHQADIIKCTAIMSNVRCRYQIHKQNLTLVYPIRRWKRSHGEWEDLDSDMHAMEEVELHVEIHPGEEHSLVVNDDWTFAHLRERLVMHFNLCSPFKFYINSRAMRQRVEKDTLCRSLDVPRCVSLKEH